MKLLHAFKLNGPWPMSGSSYCFWASSGGQWACPTAASVTRLWAIAIVLEKPNLVLWKQPLNDSCSEEVMEIKRNVQLNGC